MAQRRMFSQKIIGSDAFIEMPTSARELYFQLGMYADDDGFVNPRKIMRLLGASEDDIRMLIAKRFVLPFENGVVVIKHWLINNYIRKDIYEETLYLEQKKALKTKENKAYTENVDVASTQYRIGKEREYADFKKSDAPLPDGAYEDDNGNIITPELKENSSKEYQRFMREYYKGFKKEISSKQEDIPFHPVPAIKSNFKKANIKYSTGELIEYLPYFFANDFYKNTGWSVLTFLGTKVLNQIKNESR